ncbi:dehydrodolichyl diphosphate synthase complex subunit NUS1-like [Amphibalanus amphitrite]|uniref:dehydrodolichyl diphosphate synthase complex subunit NUS1-like n=1 Tax=Amphibalanus amphitrite TaxID=1232801 RepID=UPI001C90F358|nr:dehydrodolichyl diphosphate synthase complex subunit NUS1-like [Amphibalanus amphitrite]XP_043226591.1 dehydrodolichyl diphosphate synthase complex subunit NUS1-like [Amphibalanus amphitrite]
MDHSYSAAELAEPKPNSRMKQLLYSLLLKLLHLLFTCAELVYGAVQRLMWQFSKVPVTPPLADICANGLQLAKRPEHLGVIIVEKDICWQTLADIIVWSTAYGIHYVSLYDRSGRVRAGAEQQLRPHLERRRRALFGSVPCTVSLVEGGAEPVPTANGHSGDGDGQYHVSVALLWEPDGLGDMVAAARRLCSEVASGARHADSIDRHMFGEQLRAAAAWPDPALAIKLGPVRALLGYLPWQLRLTEVLDAPPRRPLLYRDFHRLLTAYGGIQQRMGT